MADNTDNHDFIEPTPNSTQGWGKQLNSNFRALDTDVEIRDVEANRSDYKPKDGALFRATDTGAVYLGDGTTWTKFDIDVVDVSVDGNITMADGSAIADTDGLFRFRVEGAATKLYDDGGSKVYNVQSGSFNRLVHGDPVQIYDKNGFVGVEYDSAVNASTGTLYCRNANVDLDGNRVRGTDQGGGTKPELYVNSNGEWVAKDDAGNTTVIS